MDLGLFLKDVQASGVDLSGVEGVDEGVLIHDGATGGVHDDDAVLHLVEFGFADDVPGVFLPAVRSA